MHLRRLSSALLQALASLGAAVPLFRPGESVPAASAPYSAAPSPGGGEPRAAPSGRLRHSLHFSTLEGMVAEVVTACAGGAALTAWALYLGCPPVLIGLLGSLPFLGQLVQLPAAWCASLLGHRRLALVAVAASRQVYLALVLLPFLPLHPRAQQLVLVAVAAASALLGVVGNNAWVSWMGDLVPHRIRGRYFGRRTALCTLAGTLAALAAGVVLDLGRERGTVGATLAGLALIACLAGAATTALMRKQHAPVPREPSPPLEPSAALEPLRSPAARRYLAYLLTWNAAIGISGAYFALHMLENLKMGFTLMAMHGASVAAVRILAGPLWGSALDRVGARPVLIACSFGISAIPLYWMFATEGFLWPIALDVIVSASLWSGHGLAAFNLPLELAPRGSRSFYLAIFSMGGGLAYAAASFFGGMLIQILPAHFTVFERPMVPIHVLFALSAATRFAAAVLALRIVAPGSRPVEDLAQLVKDGAAELGVRVGRRVASVRR